MNIFEKNNLVRGILDRLMNFSIPLVDNLRFKNRKERELHNGLRPVVIKSKNSF